MKHANSCGNPFAFLYEDINDLEHSVQSKLPRVSVVMPLKGFGEHNLENWRSQVTLNFLKIPDSVITLKSLFDIQITSLYGGSLEFLFVVESVEDPAYDAITLLISEFKVNTNYVVQIITF